MYIYILMYMHKNTYMHVATIIGKHTVNFKESKEGYMREFKKLKGLGT